MVNVYSQRETGGRFSRDPDQGQVGRKESNLSFDCCIQTEFDFRFRLCME